MYMHSSLDYFLYDIHLDEYAINNNNNIIIIVIIFISTIIIITVENFKVSSDGLRVCI